jgi:hypothetical protein
MPEAVELTVLDQRDASAGQGPFILWAFASYGLSYSHRAGSVRQNGVGR